MWKKIQKLFLWALAILAILFITGFFLNNFVENKAKTLLHNQISGLNFNELEIHIFRNSANIVDASYVKEGVRIHFDKLILNGFNYWGFFIDGDVSINSVKIENPGIIYKITDKQDEKKNKSSNKNNKLTKRITIDDIQLLNGDFKLLDSNSTEKLNVPRFNFSLNKLMVDSTSISSKVPFNVDGFELKADSVELKVDPRHKLNVAKINIQNKKSFLKNLKLQSFYSKNEFQKHTPIEKDRYDLSIDSIALNDMDFGFRNDSLKFVASSFVIANTNFEIYRDKLLPDDTSIKPMYSEMLRKLPFLLRIKTVKVKNTKIVYEERVKLDRAPVKVGFTKLNGEISNLTNFSNENDDVFPTTGIKVKADFMGEAPLNINWGFKVNNKSDWFNITGNMGNLSGEQMNGFLKSGLNVKASGVINEMNFEYSGNRDMATGGIYMGYNNFKIEVLKNDGKEKSDLLTTVANIFVKHSGESGKETNKNLEIKRDKTKSFWNYLWLCIRKGVLKTFL